MTLMQTQSAIYPGQGTEQKNISWWGHNVKIKNKKIGSKSNVNKQINFKETEGG